MTKHQLDELTSSKGNYVKNKKIYYMFLKYKTSEGTNFNTLFLKEQAQVYLKAAMILNYTKDFTFDFCGID